MGKRFFYLVCMGYGLVVLSVVAPMMRHDLSSDPEILPLQPEPAVPASDAAAWFQQMKPFCNAVEVHTRVKARPAPAGYRGAGFEAACFALAGEVGHADAIISKLSGDDRWRATGIVFDVAHPIADDDLAAGPVMELVVKHRPNHYMALYHAGAARYERSELAEAEDYLRRFLQHYANEDGWRANALQMLGAIESGR